MNGARHRFSLRPLRSDLCVLCVNSFVVAFAVAISDARERIE